MLAGPDEVFSLVPAPLLLGLGGSGGVPGPPSAIIVGPLSPCVITFEGGFVMKKDPMRVAKILIIVAIFLTCILIGVVLAGVRW